MPDLVPAARNVVSALRARGVDHVFTVPGESFLALLDGLHDAPDIRVIACRHEGGAAFAAEAYANLTRRPAVCAGTRAVGAGNLLIGIHTAHQNGTPLLAVLGQVGTDSRGRGAFQEADLEALLSTVSKSAVEPTEAAELGCVTRECLDTALNTRQGPTCVAFREDLLAELVPPEAFDRPVSALPPSPDLAELDAAVASASHPILVVGEEVVASGTAGVRAAVTLSEALGLPVISTWRRPDAFPNDHPHWVGQAGLSRLPCVAATIAESDLWIVLGAHLDENTLAGYTLPRPETVVHHVDPGFATPAQAHITEQRRTWLADLRARWETESSPRPRPRGEIAEGCVDQFAVAADLRRLLPEGSIVVTDAGNFSGWPTRYLRWNEPGTFLAPVSGAMGYAVPAAIGAKLARPDHTVVAIAGDGGFLMTCNELATAAAEDLDITVIVMDNQEYGTIRMHQEREYPGRPVATALGRVDCAALAVALGGRGWTVTESADFAAAFEAAVAHEGPSVVHVLTDPRQRSVGQFDHVDR